MIIFGISVSMIVFWLALALIFLLIEAATAGLTTIWFAGGAHRASNRAFRRAGRAAGDYFLRCIHLPFGLYTQNFRGKAQDRLRKNQCRRADRHEGHCRTADSSFCRRSGQGQRTGLVRGWQDTGNRY